MMPAAGSISVPSRSTSRTLEFGGAFIAGRRSKKAMRPLRSQIPTLRAKPGIEPVKLAQQRRPDKLIGERVHAARLGQRGILFDHVGRDRIVLTEPAEHASSHLHRA